MTITIEEYVALNNPKEADALIRKYGIPASKSYRDLVAKLKALTKRKREEAFIEISKINTPYKELILSISEESSNACGCSGFDGEKKSNCAGCGGNCGMSNADGDSKEIKSEEKIVSTPPFLPTEESKKGDDFSKKALIVAGGLVGLTLLAILVKKI